MIKTVPTRIVGYDSDGELFVIEAIDIDVTAASVEIKRGVDVADWNELQAAIRSALELMDLGE